jgi:RNA 3'-terminal phosphate cyclase
VQGFERIGNVSIHFTPDDWISLRQALSLSLFTGKEITIEKSLLEDNHFYHPVLDDFGRFFLSHNLGVLSVKDTIHFEPHPVKGISYKFETNSWTPLSEIFLLLLPALSHADFRSSLVFSGVTHAPFSYPPNFVQETLLGVLELIGFYAHVSLKKFGYYGSGGGAVNARIYPVEHREDEVSIKCVPEILGGRVYISKMSIDIAQREKELLMHELDLDDRLVSIIEVRNAEGMGNVVQVFVKHTIPVIYSKTIIADFTGDSADNLFESSVRDLAGEVRDLLESGMLPLHLLQELIPYLMISGKDISPLIRYNAGLEKTTGLTEKLIG